MDMVRPVVKKAISYVMGDMMRDLDQLDRMDSPRVIKTHLPMFLLNPTVLNTSKVFFIFKELINSWRLLKR